MSNVIFARTRHDYDSYQDYHRLIELSGYPTIYVDEIDPDSDNCYIISPLNGEWQAGWPDATAHIIHYQLEWETHPNDQRPNPPGVAEKWTMDVWHAEQIGARYVPIGGHEDLMGYEDAQFTPPQWVRSFGKPEPFYDVASMAYMGPSRRQSIAIQLMQKGLQGSPNGWGYERDNILRSSRAMLHVHQHDHIPGVAALRMALAAAYKLPVISETVADPGIFGHSHVLWSDYEHLADFTQMWLEDAQADRLTDFGRALHQLLCHEMTFRTCIEGAL